jgi:hypothetical protein
MITPDSEIPGSLTIIPLGYRARCTEAGEPGPTLYFLSLPVFSGTFLPRRCLNLPSTAS